MMTSPFQRSPDYIGDIEATSATDQQGGPRSSLSSSDQQILVSDEERERPTTTTTSLIGTDTNDRDEQDDIPSMYIDHPTSDSTSPRTNSCGSRDWEGESSQDCIENQGVEQFCQSHNNTNEESPKQQQPKSAHTDVSNTDVLDSSETGRYDDERLDAVLPLPSLTNTGRRHRSQEKDRSLSLSGHSAYSRRKLMEENATHKISRTIDLETGKHGGARAQVALLRDQDDSSAQCRRRRIKRDVQKRFRRGISDGAVEKEDHHVNRTRSRRAPLKEGSRTWAWRNFFQATSKRRCDGHDSDNDDMDDDNNEECEISSSQNPISGSFDRRQYKIMSLDMGEENQKKNRKWYGAGLYGEMAANDEDTSTCCYFNPNEMVVSYLFWTFRQTFLAVLLSSMLWFYFWTFLFAALVYCAGHSLPQCISVAGVDFDHELSFMNAYALSWTTFSTVGYGAIHPTTTATPSGKAGDDCSGIKILMGIEAFVGVLFASFWGAIFLSKVTRIASFAQVTFSEALVIRYGSGVAPVDDKNDSSDESGSEDGETDGSDRPTKLAPSDFRCSIIPCPVLEFRVYNRLQKQKRGEIIDATISIVASIDDGQQIKPTTKRTMGQNRGKKGKVRQLEFDSLKDLEFLDSENPTAEEIEKARRSMMSKLSGSIESEHPRQRKVMKNMEHEEKMFTKIHIESQEHPFFKRMWVAKHVLDHESPLLRPETRNLIRLNAGHWPVELNSAKSVRKCVCFDQLLVSLSGTSHCLFQRVDVSRKVVFVDDEIHGTLQCH
jgi:Ion channel